MLLGQAEGQPQGSGRPLILKSESSLKILRTSPEIILRLLDFQKVFRFWLLSPLTRRIGLILLLGWSCRVAQITSNRKNHGQNNLHITCLSVFFVRKHDSLFSMHTLTTRQQQHAQNHTNYAHQHTTHHSNCHHFQHHTTHATYTNSTICHHNTQHIISHDTHTLHTVTHNITSLTTTTPRALKPKSTVK